MKRNVIGDKKISVIKANRYAYKIKPLFSDSLSLISKRSSGSFNHFLIRKNTFALSPVFDNFSFFIQITLSYDRERFGAVVQTRVMKWVCCREGDK